MVIGKKFWKIKPNSEPVSYAPHTNVGINITGIVEGEKNIIVLHENYRNILPSLQKIVDQSAHGLGICGHMIEQNVKIKRIDGMNLYISHPVNCVSTGINFIGTVWDMDYPSVNGADSPIQALLCLDSSHGPIIFIDNSGRSVNIPANTLVKGAIYYFQISAFVQVGEDEFIGFSGN